MKKYKDIFIQSRLLVNNWDPCFLIGNGAPIDEYDALTNKFLSGVINNMNSETLISDIVNLLDNYYGTHIFNNLSNEKQREISTEINEIIEQIRKTQRTTKCINNKGFSA